MENQSYQTLHEKESIAVQKYILHSSITVAVHNQGSIMSLSKEITLTLCNSRSLNLFECKAFFFFLRSDLLAAHGTAKNN